MADWWQNQEPESPDWWLTREPSSPDWWTDGSTDGPIPPPVDLVVNGAFVADSDWTKGDGFAIAGGVCTREAALDASVLSQEIAFVEGGEYLIQIDVIALSDDLTVELTGGLVNAAADSITVVGEYEATVTALAGNNKIAIGAADITTCTIDNVRIFKVG